MGKTSLSISYKEQFFTKATNFCKVKSIASIFLALTIFSNYPVVLFN